MLKIILLGTFQKELHIRKPHYFSQNSNAKIAQTNNKTVKITHLQASKNLQIVRLLVFKYQNLMQPYRNFCCHVDFFLVNFLMFMIVAYFPTQVQWPTHTTRTCFVVALTDCCCDLLVQLSTASRRRAMALVQLKIKSVKIVRTKS